MTTPIKVPQLGESVSEATIAKWLKNPGDMVKLDEVIAELETDKVTLEVNAPSAGLLAKVIVPAGGMVRPGDLIAEVDESAKAPQASASVSNEVVKANSSQQEQPTEQHKLSPAVGKLVAENQPDLTGARGTGKDGRLTKGDVLSIISQSGKVSSATAPASSTRHEERVKMTRLRQKIAERLKESQNTAAILTTFNEIDMSKIISMRNQYKESFEKKHGIKLGFMSIFVKAAVAALQEIPAVNAQIEGDEIIYKNYYDIGVAVGTEQGLVVPVLRDADKLGFAEIEANIASLGKKAREGKLSMSELSGGTFSITNGGIYGSLMSTPIINPPQSGILGMHRTMERPVAVNGQVVIRPMMYVALSYDHRIIDGKEAVTFLVRIKEMVENPERLLFSL